MKKEKNVDEELNESFSLGDEMMMCIAEWESKSPVHHEFSLRFEPKIEPNQTGGRRIVHTYQLSVRDDSKDAGKYKYFAIDAAVVEKALEQGKPLITAAVCSLDGAEELRFNEAAPLFLAKYESRLFGDIAQTSAALASNDVPAAPKRL